MERENVKLVVRTTLILLTRIAKRTSTEADNLMATILQANEDRIVDTVLQLLSSPNQPPTEEQVISALESVGIKV